MHFYKKSYNIWSATHIYPLMGFSSGVFSIQPKFSFGNPRNFPCQMEGLFPYLFKEPWFWIQTCSLIAVSKCTCWFGKTTKWITSKGCPFVPENFCLIHALPFAFKPVEQKISDTVNSLVSDCPWGMTKWLLMGKINKISLILD